MLLEAQQLLREQSEMTEGSIAGHRLRFRLATVIWFYCAMLVVFKVNEPGPFAWFVGCMFLVYGFAEWLLAHFPLASELGAVKEGMRGVACSIAAL